MVTNRQWRVLVAATLGVGVWACGEGAPTPVSPEGGAVGAAAALGGSPGRPGDPVVVSFGREVGSAFPVPSGHDASFHAKDAIRPRTIVVEAGTTVLFRVAPAHAPAVYEPGTTPEDIDLSTATPPALPFPFPPIIDDPEGRLARAELNANFATGDLVDFSFTFEAPGRYLVICQVVPHFVGAKMYAWVDVR